MNLFATILFAACFAALFNFFFRKNSRSNGNVNAFMSVQYLFSLLVSLFFFESFNETAWNWPMLAVGMLVGFFNVLLMYLTSLALKRGPTGAVFAFQNAAAMFPGLVLFLFFGPAYGYALTALQILGMGLIIFGLCSFAMKTPQSTENRSKSLVWLPYALSCFLVQIVALTLIQWRCLLFNEGSDHCLIPTALSEADDVWFMPGFFASAFILQSVLLLFERKPVQLKDLSYGLLGGVANGISTLFLVMATKAALPAEQTTLFPCFAVMVIILCSAWARIIYQEKFDFLSNAICSIGILVSKI